MTTTAAASDAITDFKMVLTETRLSMVASPDRMHVRRISNDPTLSRSAHSWTLPEAAGTARRRTLRIIRAAEAHPLVRGYPEHDNQCRLAFRYVLVFIK
jgi:hypothetical protein